MRTSIVLVAMFCGAFAMQANATLITYDILDITDFQGYTDTNTGQTWTGDGFVGMYDNEFTHLFGLELTDFSRTALNVDVSALSGATITSAALEFVLIDGDSTTQNVTVTSFDADGTLGHFWNAPTNEGSSVYSVTGGGPTSLDVTALLQNRINGNEDWFGLHLQGSTEYLYTYTYDGYGANADSALVRLVVEYDNNAPVPEPATLSLLGMGLVGLAARARRSKKEA